MSKTAELALERQRLEAEIAAKAHDPHARLAEINAELDDRWQTEARKQAERQERIAALLAEYEPARAEADRLTSELALVLEQAADLRLKLKEMRAAPDSVHVRAARRSPENLKPSEVGEARFRLRRALALDY